jgi:hypothetical protein
MEIDDAFAGGACRCQHCGTIQTVPKRLKTGASQPMPVKQRSSTGTSKKPLYEKKVPSDIALSSGLDELAEVVASSGLGSARGRLPEAKAAQKPVMVPTAPAKKRSSTTLVLLVVVALLLVAVVGVLIGMHLH